jgi:hypothetical protein
MAAETTTAAVAVPEIEMKDAEPKKVDPAKEALNLLLAGKRCEHLSCVCVRVWHVC